MKLKDCEICDKCKGYILPKDGSPVTYDNLSIRGFCSCDSGNVAGEITAVGTTISEIKDLTVKLVPDSNHELCDCKEYYKKKEEKTCRICKLEEIAKGVLKPIIPVKYKHYPTLGCNCEMCTSHFDYKNHPDPFSYDHLLAENIQMRKEITKLTNDVNNKDLFIVKHRGEIEELTSKNFDNGRNAQVWRNQAISYEKEIKKLSWDYVISKAISGREIKKAIETWNEALDVAEEVDKENRKLKWELILTRALVLDYATLEFCHSGFSENPNDINEHKEDYEILYQFFKMLNWDPEKLGLEFDGSVGIWVKK